MFTLAVQQFVPLVRVVEAPTKEISVVDIILGGLGITGLMLLGALVLGIALGGVFIWFKHRVPDNPINGQASQTHGLQLTANLNRNAPETLRTR